MQNMSGRLLPEPSSVQDLLEERRRGRRLEHKTKLFRIHLALQKPANKSGFSAIPVSVVKYTA